MGIEDYTKIFHASAQKNAVGFVVVNVDVSPAHLHTTMQLNMIKERHEIYCCKWRWFLYWA
jgi:hypothetical protein